METTTTIDELLIVSGLLGNCPEVPVLAVEVEAALFEQQSGEREPALAVTVQAADFASAARIASWLGLHECEDPATQETPRGTYAFRTWHAWQLGRWRDTPVHLQVTAGEIHGDAAIGEVVGA